MKSKLILVSLLVVTAGLLAGVSSLLLWQPPVLAAERAATGFVIDPGVLSWGYVAAALATGISSLGAAYAVASVASAAVGALTEKPELFGRLVILVGLAEGIAIYGVIISVLILNSLRG
jgi:V/A-type H+-transporting ATPase subunit K